MSWGAASRKASNSPDGSVSLLILATRELLMECWVSMQSRETKRRKFLKVSLNQPVSYNWQKLPIDNSKSEFMLKKLVIKFLSLWALPLHVIECQTNFNFLFAELNQFKDDLTNYSSNFCNNYKWEPSLLYPNSEKRAGPIVWCFNCIL